MKRKMIEEIINQLSKKGDLYNTNKIKEEPKEIKLEPRMLSKRQRLNRGGIHL